MQAYTTALQAFDTQRYQKTCPKCVLSIPKSEEEKVKILFVFYILPH